MADLFTGAGPPELAEALVLFAIVPALLEELIFRGVLFAFFERLRGPIFAICLCALLFGIVHLDPHHALVAALLGLQLGLLRHLHGLPVAIAAHLVNNTLALSASFLARVEGGPLPSLEAGSASIILALILSGSACASLMHSMRSFWPCSPPPSRESGTDLQPPAQSDD